MNTRDRRPLVDTAVSIDEVGTQVRDDAVRHDYSARSKQRLLRFYIVDVPTYVQPWTQKDVAAMRRSSRSVQKIFSQGDRVAWSLSTQDCRAAIEFSFFMDESMGRLQELKARLVNVKIATATNFHAVYDLLDANNEHRPVFVGLLHAAQALGKRTQSGNFGQGRRRGPIGSRIMGELALFANTELTCYCLRHGIPVIYRNSFSFERIPPKVHEMYVRDREIARARGEPAANLGASMMHSHIPWGHTGLGLEGYAEFTSPLRSWISLANLRQVRAHLLGDQLPYSEADIRILSQEVDMLQWKQLFAARARERDVQHSK